jgi:pimeloyl-ACP methyl ester carboxylesterase
MITSVELAKLCNSDAELSIHARGWTGGIRFDIGGEELNLKFEAGNVSAGTSDSKEVIDVAGPKDIWDKVLSSPPPRFMSQLWTATESGLANLTKDPLVWGQRYNVADRVHEVLREAVSGKTEQRPTAPTSTRAVGTLDEVVGRYIHIELGGVSHRVYFESAGQGIPILLQHTAGSHGLQWRHLFERPEITSRFRLIAYDLPHHGKSVPPTGAEWWKEPYKLTAERAMELPLALSKALKLDRPVFMGCSVGGLLALDLARYHPDAFRAVIPVEPSLKVHVPFDSLSMLWDSRVSNEYKARMMRALTAPSSPEAYRREVEHTYAAGWPQAFLGDLWFYTADHDLRTEAKNIDTTKCAVHMLSGEYDASATLEDARACQKEIKGSTLTEMMGMGHFPMSEDPVEFVKYLMPILEKIEGLKV